MENIRQQTRNELAKTYATFTELETYFTYLDEETANNLFNGSYDYNSFKLMGATLTIKEQYAYGFYSRSAEFLNVSYMEGGKSDHKQRQPYKGQRAICGVLNNWKEKNSERAVKLARQIYKVKDGATLTTDGETPDYIDGYYVANYMGVILNDYDFSDLVDVLLLKLLQLEILDSHITTDTNMEFIGVWKDNRELYIDLSGWQTDKQKAIKDAKHWEQLAIFDIKAMDAITI